MREKSGDIDQNSACLSIYSTLYYAIAANLNNDFNLILIKARLA